MEEVIVDLGSTGAWVVEPCTDGAGAEGNARERRISLQPVAYTADGELLVGGPAHRLLADAPITGVSEWLDRIGDDVPIVLDGRRVLPQDLLALVLRGQLQDTASALRLVVPASWGLYRQELVRDAVCRTGLSSVQLVAAPLATVSAPGLELPETGQVLVIDAGDRRTSASLVDLDGPDGPRLAGVAVADLGGSDIDEALLEFVRPRLAGPVPDGDALLEACRTARERLSLTPATELLPPGTEPLRLVRAELDALVGDRLRSTVEALLDRIGRGRADAVVLAGGLARMPLLVETVSALVDRPVQVPADPGLAAVRGAARIPAVPATEQGEAAGTTILAAAVPEASEEQGTPSEPRLEEQPEARTRHGLLVPLRRYGGLAAAAAAVVVVLSAPMALPGLDVVLSSGRTEPAAGSVVTEPGSAESADDQGSTDAAPSGPPTRPGPLRFVADLLTPDSAVAHERAPRDASVKETPGPLQALAERLTGATPSGRPLIPEARAERSTSPASATSSREKDAAAPAAPSTSKPTESTQPQVTDAPAPTTPTPSRTTAPTTQPTSPATQPATTAPATTAPTTSAPAPKPEPTTAPPASQQQSTVPAPAPDPVVESKPAPASQPASASSATSSAPDPGPTSEVLDAGAV